MSNNSVVTLFYNESISAHQNIINKFVENNFTVNHISTRRDIPVVEFNGVFITGTRNIFCHFFPKL